MKGLKKRLATLLAVALVASTISFPGYAEPEDGYEYADMELGSDYRKASESDATFEAEGGDFNKETSTLTLAVDDEASVSLASPSDAVILTASSSDAVKVVVATDSNAVKVTAQEATDDPVTVTVTYASASDATPQDTHTAKFFVVVDETAEENPGQLISEQFGKPIVLNAGEETKILVTSTPSDASIKAFKAEVTRNSEALEVISTSDTPDADNAYAIVVKAKPVEVKTYSLLTVTGTVNGKESKLEFEITVNEKAADTAVQSMDLFIDKPSGRILTNQKILVTAKIYPTGANDTIKFVSDNEVVLEQVSETLVKDGVATAEFRAYKSGRANIHAEAEKSGVKSNVMAITATKPFAVMSFKEQAIAMKPGAEAKAVIGSIELPETDDEDLLDFITESIEYTSSDPTIVKVDAKTGDLKALKVGMVTLRAESEYANGQATSTIIVAEDATYQISIDNSTAFDRSLDTGILKKVYYSLYQVKEDGSITDVSDQYKASWKSSNPSVVSVDTTGVLSTLADGTAEITVTAADANGKAVAEQILKVTVKKVVPASKEEATSYKNNQDISKVLNGEDVSKEAVETASTLIAETLQTMDMGALLKSEALGTVMSDIGTLEKLLKEKGVTTEKQPDVTTDKITGIIEVSGLMLNGYLDGSPAPQLSVQDADSDIVIPKKVQGKEVAQTVAIDISADVSISTPVQIKLPLPKGFTAQNTMLLHYENGNPDSASIVPCAVVNGKLEFTVGSFSPFVLVQTTGGGDNNNNNNNSSGSSSSGSTRAVEAGKWVQNESGWWYRYNDGTWPANRWVSLSYAGTANWYHFDQNGYMQSGWFQDTDGRKYYLNPVSNGTKGAMLTGWQMIEGNWYYFNTTSDGFKGSLFVNTTTPDNYKVNENGVWVK